MAMKHDFTVEQLEAIKSITLFAEKFADQVLKVFQRTGLDKIPGCDLSIDIDPEFTSIVNQITFGTDIERYDVGKFTMKRGVEAEKYELTTDSAEYEVLFADESLRAKLLKMLTSEKPLPPDGLWLSNSDDPGDVGGGQ